MTSLIPEPRRDKNGKTTIRYVRAGEAAKSPTPMPVPAVVKEVTESDLVDKALARLGQSWIAKNATARNNLTTLLREDVVLFNTLIDHFVAAAPPEKAVWEETLTNRQMYEPAVVWDGKEPTRWFSHVYKEKLDFYPLATALLPRGIKFATLYCVDIDRSIEKPMSMQLSGMYPLGADTTKALMISMSINALNEKPGHVFLDEKHIAYLAANIDRIIPIVGELTRMRTTEQDAIETLLATENAALREGVL